MERKEKQYINNEILTQITKQIKLQVLKIRVKEKRQTKYIMIFNPRSQVLDVSWMQQCQM